MLRENYANIVQMIQLKTNLFQTLKDFLEYLEEMEEMARRVDKEWNAKNKALVKAKIAKQDAGIARKMAEGRQVVQPKPPREKAFKPVEVAVGYAVDTRGAAMHNHEITTSTFTGLYVTVSTALSLVDYLHVNFNYQYLLTRRLNQDALEVSAKYHRQELH